MFIKCFVSLKIMLVCPKRLPTLPCPFSIHFSGHFWFSHQKQVLLFSVSSPFRDQLQYCGSEPPEHLSTLCPLSRYKGALVSSGFSFLQLHFSQNLIDQSPVPFSLLQPLFLLTFNPQMLLSLIFLKKECVPICTHWMQDYHP